MKRPGNPWHGPSGVTLFALAAGMAFAVALDFSAPRVPAQDVGYETMVRWAEEGILTRAQVGRGKVAGLTQQGNVVYATIPEGASAEEFEGMATAVEQEAAEGRWKLPDALGLAWLVALAAAAEAVARWAVRRRVAAGGGFRPTTYEEELTDSVMRNDLIARSGSRNMVQRNIEAKASLSEDGTLIVDLERLEGAEVHAIQLWDMDVGGDALFVPEWTLNTPSQEAGEQSEGGIPQADGRLWHIVLDKAWCSPDVRREFEEATEMDPLALSGDERAAQIASGHWRNYHELFLLWATKRLDVADKAPAVVRAALEADEAASSH